MRSVFRALKQIKEHNGYEAFFVLSSMYLERVSYWKFPFKVIKLLVQRHYLCDISPYSFDSVEGILTCRLPHPFLIIINSMAKIGINCTIFHGVTIGNREGKSMDMGGAKIGDNVFIGCGTTILGKVSIGSNCRIGAMSVILRDVEANRTITGIFK